MEPLVVAVVLTWNDTIMSSACIESLYGSTYNNLKIVVVDNGSNPPACPILKNRFPGIIPVQLSKNYGFTGGCNRGLEQGMSLGAKYLFLLNNDTIIHSEAVSNLVNCLETHNNVGIASALLLNPGNPKTVQTFQGWVDIDSASVTWGGNNELLTDVYRQTVICELVPACAILIRAQTLKEVGLFDERLFTNWEDYDLCIRCTKAGWHLAVVGTAEVVHRPHQTTGTISPFITYFSTRNRLICLFRYGDPYKIFKNTFSILRSFYWKIKKYGFTNLQCHKAFIKAWIDFLSGVRGEGNVPSNRDDRITGAKSKNTV